MRASIWSKRSSVRRAWLDDLQGLGRRPAAESAAKRRLRRRDDVGREPLRTGTILPVALAFIPHGNG